METGFYANDSQVFWVGQSGRSWMIVDNTTANEYAKAEYPLPIETETFLLEMTELAKVEDPSSDLLAMTAGLEATEPEFPAGA